MGAMMGWALSPSDRFDLDEVCLLNANAAGDGQALRRILRRGVSDIIVESEFVERLGAGKPLRLKMGFDPSVLHNVF